MKKRRGSISPDRGSAKRARVSSSSIQSRQADGDNDVHYANKHDDRATSLPTADDWIFRVQVISSSTALNDDVFKKAVQGLVKICFPPGVLEQLGIQVLEQHMQEENAPEENIGRMKDIFRAEMIPCVANMLAEYLDTPARVEAGVQCVVAASAKLHGHNLNSGEDIQPGSGESPTKKKSKKRDKSKRREVLQQHARDADELETNMDTAASGAQSFARSSQLPLPENRDSKISSRWLWDVEPDKLAPEDVPKHFQKTSDLFAFHALPVARKKLGSDAKRKQVRHEMQNMLADMHNDEYDKWIESLRKLLDGDAEMLVRPEPEPYPTTNNRSRTAATPAPVDAWKRAKLAARDRPSKSSQHVGRKETVSTQPQNRVTIKREANPVSSVAAEAEAQEASIAATTTALRHLSTEERDVGPPAKSIEGQGRRGSLQDSRSRFGRDSGKGAEGTQAQTLEFEVETPIIDLLWGVTVFSPVESVQVVRAVMDSLTKRVSGRSIGIQNPDGTTTIQQMSELKNALAKTFVSAARKNVNAQFRQAYEYKLIPWVIANPARFPELLPMRFVFAEILPCNTPVSDSIFDPCTPLPQKESQHTSFIVSIVAALNQRGVLRGPDDDVHISRIQREIDHILSTGVKDMVKRARLERVLRRAIFPHKAQFPQLKFSPVIKAWESMTKQQW